MHSTSQVNSIPTFWDWSINHLSPGLYSDFWYNGILTERPGYLSDGTSFILGKTRIRQVRVKQGMNNISSRSS